MTLTVDEINVEYQAALSDAKIDSQQARLYLAADMGTSDLGAVWHPPGVDLVVDAQFPDSSQLADANAPEHRDLHRIVAPASPTDAVTLAALLRHELEHARQHDVLGKGFLRLQEFLEKDVLPRRAGGLDGCAGGLINAVPTEIDCNAAASVYVENRFHSEEIESLRKTPMHHLVCSLIGPEPIETLPARMVAFVFIHRRGAIESAAEAREPLGQILDQMWPGAGDLWAELDRAGEM